MVMVFNDTFNNISDIYRGGSFFRGGEPENQEKTTDPPQVTDKLYHIKVYRVQIAMSGIQTHNVGGF